MAVNRKARREDALVTALSVTDTSRRVGWAKYFSAADQLDELSRDLNVARSDVDLMSRFAGYLYGALGVAAPSLIGRLPRAIDPFGVLSMLPDKSIDAGRRAARKPKNGAQRGALAKSGMADDDLYEFAAEVLGNRRRSSSSVEVTGSRDGGAIISRNEQSFSIHPDDIEPLVEALIKLTVEQ